MNIKNKILGTLALLAALATSSHALPLTGNYSLNGTAQLDSGTVNTATQLISGSGLFSSLSGDLAAYNGEVFTISTWNFNSGVVSPLWQTTNLQFDLANSFIKQQGGGDLVVDGKGTLFLKSDPVGTAREYTFNFTTQDPNIGQANGNFVFSFSVSGGPVPDAGSSVVLLGAALIGVALFRRKIAA